MTSVRRPRPTADAFGLAVGAAIACALSLESCVVGPIIAEPFVAEPYVRPSAERRPDTLSLALDPTISPMNLLYPDQPKRSARYVDFRGSVAASVARMLDGHFAAVVPAASDGGGDYRLSLHRFRPTGRVVSIAEGEVSTTGLYAVGIDYDAVLEHRGRVVSEATGEVESGVTFTTRRGFEAANLDAVERALGQLWGELAEGGLP